MNLKEACTLAVKVLSKTMDSTTLSSEKGLYTWDMTSWRAVEFATVGRNEEGQIYIRLWDADEIDDFLFENELSESKVSDAMQD